MIHQEQKMTLHKTSNQLSYHDTIRTANWKAKIDNSEDYTQIKEEKCSIRIIKQKSIVSLPRVSIESMHTSTDEMEQIGHLVLSELA